MSQTIDVTGLPPEAVKTVQSLVGLLRQNGAFQAKPAQSIFDLIGKAPVLRSGEDIAKQVAEERDSWAES
jgi:hypothetical protein